MVRMERWRTLQMVQAERQEADRGEACEPPQSSPGRDDARAVSPHSEPADAACAAGPAWTVTVEDQVYGPYGLAQMLAFIAEGRVAITSMVSLTGTGTVNPVSDDPVLSRLFYATDTDAPSTVGRARAGELDATQEAPWQTFTAVEGTGHFLIAAEVKWPVNRFDAAMLALGAAYQLMETSWLLTSDRDFDTVCKTLVQNVGPKDKLLVSDLGHDRMVSFNLGEAAARRIHRVWRGVTPISQVLGMWSAATWQSQDSSGANPT